MWGVTDTQIYMYIYTHLHICTYICINKRVCVLKFQCQPITGGMPLSLSRLKFAKISLNICCNIESSNLKCLPQLVCTHTRMSSIYAVCQRVRLCVCGLRCGWQGIHAFVCNFNKVVPLTVCKLCVLQCALANAFA